MRQRFIYVAAVIVVAAGAAFAVGSPAQASGTCWTYGYVYMADGEHGYRPIPRGNGSDTYTCGMSQGASNDWVALLQYSLNKCYGSWQDEPYNILNDWSYGFEPTYDLVVDGQFGAKTKRALQKAQSAAGISADGQYGPQTRSHILWWSGGEYGYSGDPVCEQIRWTSSSNIYPVQYDGDWGWADYHAWLPANY